VFSHKIMLRSWTGAVVMGLVYLMALKEPEESAAFVAGQIFLGLIGIGRELYVKKQFSKTNLKESSW